MTGPEFALDAKTVHQMVLHNVNEDSDAYTYFKTLVRHRDGRRDVLALRDRYANDAPKQAIINAAKSSLANLRYKNERSFPFERFSAKLQKNHDDLAENGRAVDNGDIVDALWGMVQESSLQTFLAALKVDYMRNPRSYKLILQDIAAEVEDKKPTTFGNRQAGINAVYTREGFAPSTGVHTSDGSIFIGNYDTNKWKSDSVKPYHKQILDARSQEGGGNNNSHPSRRDKRRTNALKRSKSKIKKLKTQLQISAAKLEKAGVTGADNDKEDEEVGDSDKAGDSFGGRRSKSNKNN